jgi:hypothetical protein
MDEIITKVIKDLRGKQRELREKADKIDDTILSLQELFGGQLVLPEVSATIQTNELSSRGIYRGLAIGQAAIRFLKSEGAPKKTREIADALEVGGVKSSDMYRAVYNALDTNDEAVMVEGKMWALKEWQA